MTSEPKAEHPQPEPTQEAEPSKSALELEVEQLRREAQECKDKYFLVLAESENARKRLMKERQEATRHAIMEILAEMLKPIDQFENGLKFTDAASSEVQNWAMGFKMILSHFKDVLASHGVSSFHSTGALFDPHFHEAVEVVETDEYPEGTIISELAVGYKMGDRALRPARVKVAKAIEPKQDNNR